MKRNSLILPVVFLLVQNLFAHISTGYSVEGVTSMETDGCSGFSILSPMEGNWANKQALVLEVPDNCDVFYSFSGSHPMESGFAYDGPVMIEAQGNVPLKIALVFPQGNAIIYSVNYSVATPKATDKVSLELDLSRSLVNYSLGQKIKIPTGYSYRLGESQVFLQGEQILSLAGGAFPHRYLPCEVTDGVNSWRFIISPDGGVSTGSGATQSSPETQETSHLAGNDRESLQLSVEEPTEGTVVGTGGTSVPYELYFPPDFQTNEVSQDVLPQKAETPEPLVKVENLHEPPFQILDWNILQFTNNKLLYAIDDSYWQGVSDSIVLDRSVGHTVYWQSMDYKEGNPVYSFYLPPKPSKDLKFQGRDAVTLTLGANFTIKPSNSNILPTSSFVVDAFYGEELESDFSIDIYYNDVYQGKGDVSLFIDKCPPSPPTIEFTSDMFYNRDKVQVTLEKSEEGELFYFIDLIASEEIGFKELSLNTSNATITDLENFHVYQGNPLVLESHKNHAHLFLVRAFAKDEYGNSSSVVEYKTIVDPVNYYIEAGASTVLSADGSLARPFTSLQEALEKIDSQEFVRLHLKGIQSLNEIVIIPFHCEILGYGIASGLNFQPGSGIVVQDSNVSIKNCIVEFQDKKTVTASYSSIFTIEDGSLSLVKCEILGDYQSNGTLISAVDGSLSINNSNITLRAGRYGAMISSLRSSLFVNDSKFTVVAPTAVVFSLSAGQLELSNSECKVFGQLGRVAELTSVKFSLKNNSFHGVFEDNSATSAQLIPVWQDKRSKLIEDSGNKISGFSGS